MEIDPGNADQNLIFGLMLFKGLPHRTVCCCHYCCYCRCCRFHALSTRIVSYRLTILQFWGKEERIGKER